MDNGMEPTASMRSFSKSQKLARTLWCYCIAVVTVAAGLGVSLLLQHWTNYRILFPFFAAVIASGWIGGRGPAWFAVVLSLMAVDYFFGTPLYDWAIDSAQEAYFVPFAVAIVVAGWCGSLRKRVEHWSAESREVSIKNDTEV